MKLSESNQALQKQLEEIKSRLWKGLMPSDREILTQK